MSIPPTAGELKGKRVLVIDDDAEARELIRLILSSEGYDLMEADSAHQVETMVHSFRPDLILCDMMMPGRDGLEVARAVRSGPDNSSVRIVFVTAKSFEGDKKAALEAGAAGYLVKPFKPDQLLEVIQAALASQARLTLWGTRGSIPTPERHSGLYGGNTPCVHLSLPANQHLIFDAGTGIRLLGNSIVGQSPMRIALCLTHFHWDHIFGLPFFAPFYVPANEITVYGPGDNNEALTRVIKGEMGGDYFPISVESFRSSVEMIAVKEQSFEALGVSLSTLYALHPCRTLAYRAEFNGHSVVYAPDNELLPESCSPRLSGEALRFAQFAAGASYLIHDCTYSRHTYELKRGWGHSCGEMFAAVAAHAQVEKAILFHHDPESSDEEVEAIHHEFQMALKELGAEVPSEPAREGASFSW